MFKFSTEVTDRERQIITRAIDLMNNQFPPHCLRISPASSTDRDYIMVKKSSYGCYSRVGTQGGSQELILGNGCYTQRTIIHIFGYALGLYPEQSRPDRDQYVEIIPNNIRPTMAHNFAKKSSYNVTSVPYDGRSIMHDRHDAYSKSTLATIRSKIPGLPDEELGSSDRFTDLDIAKLKLLYGCL